MSSPEVQLADDLQRIAAVAEEEANAASAGDIARYFHVLTANAIFMPPNVQAKRGDELHMWLRNFMENFRVEWIQYVHDETALEGPLAYHRYSYHWKVTPKPPGEPIESKGKGMHVLRRQADGSWKIAINIWNANP